MSSELAVGVAGTVTTRPPRSRAWRMRRLWAAAQAYLYLLPTFLILSVFAYAPAVFVFYISFFKWNFLRQGDQPFVGWGNYQYLLSDPNFWQAVRTTLTYVLVSVPLHVIFSLLLALLLMSGIRGKAFWRVALFTPFITPLVPTITIWYWMFDRYHGLFNGALALVHQPAIDWLSDPHWALPSVIAYTTWKSVGFSIVIFMAGISNLDTSLIEAARVDGANVWQVFRHITWPLLLPVTAVVLLLSTIEAFKMFQPVFLLIGPGGGPLNAARTLGLYLFTQAFSTNPHDGLGAAISVVIFLIVLTISAIQLVVTGRGANAGGR